LSCNPLLTAYKELYVAPSASVFIQNSPESRSIYSCASRCWHLRVLLLRQACAVFLQTSYRKLPYI